MRIGIIGPSKLREKELVEKVAEIVAEFGHEIVITPDKGSASECFAEKYLSKKGKKVWEILPEEDTEFGYKKWVNVDLGESINCGTWRNQPEKFNEETDLLLVIGYAVGGLFEIGYSKWFKPKPVCIIKELVSGELPKEINESLDIKYISIEDLEKELK